MQFTKRDMPKGEGGSFLRLEEGVPVEGYLRGEVHEFWQIWPYGGEKQVFDKRVPGSVSRFKANFVVAEAGKPPVPMVFEFNIGVYNQFSDIAESYNITETRLKLIKRGSGKQTTYTVLPILNPPTTPSQIKTLSQVKLHILDTAQKSPPDVMPQARMPKNHAPPADEDFQWPTEGDAQPEEISF